MDGRLAIASVVTGLVLVVSGCGGSGSTSLRVAFGPADGSKGLVVFKLQCDPPGGTIPDPAAACSTIESQVRLVIPRPSNSTCSPPIGLWAVTITGTYRGKTVRQYFGSCSNEVFAWMRIARYKPCPGNFIDFATPCTHGPYAFGRAHMRGVFPSVPKLVGMRALVARQTLALRGLQAQFVPAFRPRSRVVAQSLRAGASAKVYEVVRLTIAGR